ncbi:MAG: isoprenylcysteine carboxylmethyltransferase family protein [Saprospiraceae bacterium]|nr:isoprenylcysteine carboxylmethyltransferase family protein [Saprospiraceae bacterium]MCF8251805.1 isoprenylcysteine carboxylmethyltransferase family protein [Saprospiraceae bacterium]MCF8281459.1 isoprenylcysteine carboxylmethyltransferase family protein [Bacteroidales bacterium]MCF8313519.1 isoprenylcysteine carboxylmethyltransferase family protein [Saprospiraceae bacterium]MCF8442258.1 isoprenylcysteine carboxylmethyltransferase family protein [Saprospiraceae bacterium]
MHTLYFILALIAYYTLHSLLAANGVKAALTKIVSPRYYRLLFNVVAVGLFAAIFTLYFLVEKTALWTPNLILPYPGAFLALAGISWIVRAMKRYNLDEFMGLEQLRTDQKPQHNKLIIRGLNGRVRHPLYFGTLLVVIGILLIFPTDAMFAFALISTIYLVIGSRLEEEKLVTEFGEAYRRYQRDVPMLLPFRVKKPRWF